MKIVSLAALPEEPVSHNPEIKKKVLLRENELPGCLIKLAQACFAPGQAAGAHAHPEMYEVFLIEKGAGTIRVEQVERLLAPGDCVVVEPGEIHDIANSGPMDLVITYLAIKSEQPMTRRQDRPAP